MISSERLCQIGFAVRRRFIRLRITCWGVCRPTATYVVPDDIQRTVWGGRSVAVSFNVLFRSRLVEHINALNVPLRARAQCGCAAQCDNARTPLVLGQQSQRSHARPPFSQSISDSRGPAATAPHAQSFPALPPLPASTTTTSSQSLESRVISGSAEPTRSVPHLLRKRHYF